MKELKKSLKEVRDNMCKYCALLSGDRKSLDENTDITIVRHNIYFTIETDDYEVDINYCPMCGRKLGD